jgi:hypothetical protein
MVENKSINKLPNEIILEIIYNIGNIKDLINLYETSKKYKNVIKSEINKHFNKNKCSDIYKYFDQTENFDEWENLKYMFDDFIERKHLYKIIIKNNQLERYIINYLESYNKKMKNDSINKIKDIYKYNFINSIDIYKCYNCHKYICKKCCTECKNCNVYKNDDYVYYHCNSCENRCFDIITKKLKDINLENEKDIEKYKDIIIDEYFNRIDFDDSEEAGSHEFINDLNLSNETKYVLRKYPDDLKCTIEY